jgi:hypothetical protein
LSVYGTPKSSQAAGPEENGDGNGKLLTDVEQERLRRDDLKGVPA